VSGVSLAIGLYLSGVTPGQAGSPLQPCTKGCNHTIAVDPTAHQLARSLIAAHGDDALAIAEKALANVRSLFMKDKTDVWLKVIEAIKTAKAGKL
jgi:hypothetical protein